MKEVWKNIFGYEGLYQVSNLGRVKSFVLYHGTNERILKPYHNKDGYLEIGLTKDNKRTHFLIHRLVALHFIPNDDLFKTEINHKDENKENNNVNNLEWCNRTYNVNYGSRLEKCSKAMINHPNKIKKINQFSLDGTYIKTFQSIIQIERELGFNNSHICQCCKGKRKTANGFIWKYA